MNRPSSKTLVVCAILAVLSFSCDRTPTKIGILESDLRAIPAILAQDQGYYKNAGKVMLQEFGSFEEIQAALAGHSLHAAYVGANEALTGAATGKLDLKFLIISTRKNFKPEVVLVADAKWAAERTEKAKELIEAHRRAVRLMDQDKGAVLKTAANWTGKTGPDLVEALEEIRFEGGMDRAALIDVLDDLRTKKIITAEQADAMALKLVEEEAVSAKP